MTIRVVLADDQVMVRTGLRVLCERDGDIAVVAEAADGAAAVDLAAEHRPDVVLMDIRMPVLDGLSAARRILDGRRAVRVLMLTTYEIDEYVIDAVRAGASGFISKDIGPEGLRDAVRTVVAGQTLFSPNAARTLSEAFAAAPGPPPDTDRLSPLTARESEVLALVARGMSNKEIGRVLSLSPATVKTHVNRSMTKLDARDRAQLVVLAYESGLVRAGATRRPGA
ncbi:LuxR family two component transcriptional regulator [Murinocardiopsis flavida]|uniref:LuxR family two component transcriptional regulator n=1 Tax=Murinocardiopsis flavida TaxID=645275 RepID=A0A2P8DE33_9ACTN|nr:response regulator transcription factor [Murinocardiopsis flavida]PSK95462.1 LuxR family two component transcriptional regulator [Murinocardiopsis flavida]